MWFDNGAICSVSLQREDVCFLFVLIAWKSSNGQGFFFFSFFFSLFFHFLSQWHDDLFARSRFMIHHFEDRTQR